MTDEKKRKLKEAAAYCPTHQISYPAHLGCPRCRTGN